MDDEKKLSALLEKGRSLEAVEKVLAMKDADVAKLNPKLLEKLVKAFKDAEKTLEGAPQHEEVQEKQKQYHQQAERLEKLGRGVSAPVKENPRTLNEVAEATFAEARPMDVESDKLKKEYPDLSEGAAKKAEKPFNVETFPDTTADNRKRLTELTAALDLDGDGKVSKDEITAAVNAAKKAGISLDVDALSRVMESSQLLPSAKGNQAQQQVKER